MADVKISSLPTDTSPTLTDYVSTVDVETSTTKKITLQNLGALVTANQTIKRQNDTTNSTVNNARIECGWGAITNTASPALSEAVTFQTAFSSTPIIFVSFASDASTAVGYGSSTGNNVEGRVIAKSAGQTASGFNLWLHTGGGTNFATGTSYYTWIAIGS